MKKLTFALLFTLFFTVFSTAPFAFATEKYVVFFAQTSEIPQSVLNLINQSKRFCLSVPISSTREAPEALEELISYGKIEPSLVFIPEPIFPILLSIYATGSNTSAKMELFKDYIDYNKINFQNNIHKTKYGLFLETGEVSDNIMEYFAKQNLAWVNISNSKEDLLGVYTIDKMNSFAISASLPTNSKEALRWIMDRKQKVIPVLLTKAHLQNVSFMSGLISDLDDNKDILPASALYIVQVRKDLLIPKENVIWLNKTAISKNVLTKLSEAASIIQRYKNSSKYSEPLYRNAQDELIYLASKNFLSSIDDANISGNRMFDVAYSNIFRLLDGKATISVTFLDQGPVNEPPPIIDEDAQRATGIENGMRVDSNGVIQSVDVVAAGEAINISVNFNKGKWVDSITYVEIYIDMNHIENIGISSMLNNKGYLSPSSAWEYAVTVYKNKAVLYKATSDKPTVAGEFAVVNGQVSIPRTHIRGNPRNWAIQAVAVQKEKIIDYLGNDKDQKSKMLQTRTITIPGIRVRR
jgi:hypothetical protein